MTRSLGIYVLSFALLTFATDALISLDGLAATQQTIWAVFGKTAFHNPTADLIYHMWLVWGLRSIVFLTVIFVVAEFRVNWLRMISVFFLITLAVEPISWALFG